MMLARGCWNDTSAPPNRSDRGRRAPCRRRDLAIYAQHTQSRSPAESPIRAVRRTARLRLVSQRPGRKVERFGSRARYTGGERTDGPRRFQRCPLHLRRRHVDLLQTQWSFVVRTDGPDGELHDYDIAYVFGVRPLQQYLIAFPNGKLQALGIAWDARPRRAGGQRWFHLYPDAEIT